MVHAFRERPVTRGNSILDRRVHGRPQRPPQRQPAAPEHSTPLFRSTTRRSVPVRQNSKFASYLQLGRCKVRMHAQQRRCHLEVVVAGAIFDDVGYHLPDDEETE